MERRRIANILRRDPAGMYVAISEAAKAAGTYLERPEDAPDESVFAGLDVGDMYASAGPFRIRRWFSGIEGTYREIWYVRPDGRTVRWTKAPCGAPWKKNAI